MEAEDMELGKLCEDLFCQNGQMFRQMKDLLFNKQGIQVFGLQPGQGNPLIVIGTA